MIRPFLSLNKIAFGIVVIWLLILSVTFFNSDNPTSEQVKSQSDIEHTIRIDSLEMSLTEHSEQIVALQQKKQANPTQLDKLTAQVQTLINQQSNIASKTELTDLQYQLNQQNDALNTLKNTVITQQAKATNSPTKPKNQSQVKIQKSSIPFKVLSLDYRAGQYVLSVMPLNSKAQTISSAVLLEVGQRIGNWRLEKVTEKMATFSVGGKTRNLIIPY